MDPSRFDGLVRSLAQPASRRRTVGVLVGGALATFAGVSPSDAKRRHHHGRKHGKGGNSACAKFCAAVFGADTPEAAQCTSDAAQNKPTSLCAICQADVSNLCGTTCCTGTDTCGGGGTSGVCGCAPNCSGKCGGSDGCGGTCPNTCPVGADCINNVCSCRHNPCPTGDSSVCSTLTSEICNPDGSAVPRCCCSPNGNPNLHCGPGPNAICCSGYCVQVPGEAFGLCGPQPTT